jgi:hypothetical protein
MELWTYGLCVSSEFRDDVLLVAPDALGDGGANAHCQPLQPLGLLARPLDPSDGKGAGCLYTSDGDDTYAMPTTDPRATERIPQGSKGSTTLHGTGKGPSYVHIDGDTGYIQILVKYSDTKSHSLTFDTSSAEEPTITLRHGEGHGIVLTHEQKILIESAGGTNRIEIDDSKILFNGPVQFNGGVTAGGDSGNKVATTVDLDSLKNATQASISTLVAPNGPVTGSPIVYTAVGSSKLSAAP